MKFSDVVSDLFSGYWYNILIASLVFIITFGFGVLFTFLAGRNEKLHKIVSWLSLLSECLVPMMIVVIMFYVPGISFGANVISRFWAVVIGLVIAFMWHMPARYIAEYSFLKNMLYNGLDLISTLFKWSTIANVLMVVEVVQSAKNFAAYGLVWPLFVTLVISSATILPSEIGKRIVKHCMK